MYIFFVLPAPFSKPRVWEAFGYLEAFKHRGIEVVFIDGAFTQKFAQRPKSLSEFPESGFLSLDSESETLLLSK